MTSQQAEKAKFLAENSKPGEVYAGLLLGKNGDPDQHIFLLSGHEKSITWPKAKAWAKKAGGELPTRREQALLFANCKEKFDSGSYWSGEQFAGDESYAWCQDFGYGDQYGYRELNELRARAVRRLPLKEST